MACFLTKEELYKRIEVFRHINLGIDFDSYPLNLVEMCKECTEISLESVPFKTPSLRGMAVPSHSKNENDIILLNSNRPKDENNFVCAHELVHLGLHRNEDCPSFSCFDDVRENQNSFFEWHANEGGAEIVVPYKLLLPIVKNNFYQLTSYENISIFKQNLAQLFNVSIPVIVLRLENLKYEIHQYLNGCDLDKIKILSKNEQNKKRINIKSINDIQIGYVIQNDYSKAITANFLKDLVPPYKLCSEI